MAAPCVHPIEELTDIKWREMRTSSELRDFEGMLSARLGAIGVASTRGTLQQLVEHVKRHRLLMEVKESIHRSFSAVAQFDKAIDGFSERTPEAFHAALQRAIDSLHEVQSQAGKLPASEVVPLELAAALGDSEDCNPEVSLRALLCSAHLRSRYNSVLPAARATSAASPRRGCRTRGW